VVGVERERAVVEGKYHLDGNGSKGAGSAVVQFVAGRA
jgi:hypothetical protein